METEPPVSIGPALEALARQIPLTMLADQHRLRSRLRGIERVARSRPIDVPLAKLSADVQRSAARREQRSASLPKPWYPDNLPVVERRAEIAKSIADNQVLILAGETGSGKTTQLPKICLELGRGVAGLIGHTQPRRIAARSVAQRIAQELDTPLGHAVGYKVRFNETLSPQTYVKLMTDGILLAETQHDRFLEQYDTLVIDEAHERSLNIDFLLGYLKQLLPKRPDLKLIITSATIDPQGFSRHFNDAPVIEVSGRAYPVDVRYRPVEITEADEDEPTLQEAIVAAVEECYRDAPFAAEQMGILVFLSGEREIRETAETLKKHAFPARPALGWGKPQIIPLYARLSYEEQAKVFQQFRGVRIVLATNVAETSLTVPGIHCVIDPGLARINRYSPHTRVQRLQVEPVSQASADQRKGRCGRVAPGVCIRLYSQESYESRPRFTVPEILRTNLASVILQMKALRLGEVQDFPFLESPDYRAVRDGYATLHELGAIDEENKLTPLGAALARLPIDPRIGRMVLAARDEGVMDEVLVIASALAVQDPRERPIDKQEQADAAHLKFVDETSDFLGYLKLWDWFHANRQKLSQSKLRKLCQENFVSYVRLREWHDVHQQLHALVTEMGLSQRPAPRHEAPPGPARRRRRTGNPRQPTSPR